MDGEALRTRLRELPVERKPAAAPLRVDPGNYRALHVAGQDLWVFLESIPLIVAMLDDIRAARERVWLETYIYADDAAGRAVAEALIERAQAGVDVRVIYDAFGSHATPGGIFERMREAGVRVHCYHSLFEAVRRFSLFRVFNRRDHRKLLVVDERVGYFGGMNVVDQTGIESIEDAKARHLPKSAGWRDVHVRLSGPKHAELADAFERLWRKIHRERRLRWPRWRIGEMFGSPEETIDFFDFRPGRRSRRAHRVFIPLIRRARKTITLSMAYFVPAGSVLRALVRAAKRGVKIEVAVPGDSDVKLAQYAGRYLYAYLLSHGIQVHEHCDRMLHSKVMVIDGEWTVIGSCNLDMRSFWLNREFAAVIHSRKMAGLAAELCREDIENSIPVTRQRCRRPRWWQRLTDRLAWSLRRWL